METEFQKAVGKSTGEVARDINDFLNKPYPITHRGRQFDLCRLSPDLNMHEQFSFALLSEAYAQGWETRAAEGFYRRAVSSAVSPDVANAMVEAFRDRKGSAYRSYEARYGNRFSLSDGSYWATCLALSIDAGSPAPILRYLRLFTVCLMEFAYMEDRNPDATYTWQYYESFRALLDALTAEPEQAPLPLKVRALGGTAGKRNGDSYTLSLGVDIENPNPDRMARDVHIDVTLKDRDGNTVTVIKDRIQSIDPATVYHYGITRTVRGAATAGISASAKANAYLKLTTPIMKHAKLTSLRLFRSENATRLSGALHSEYDRAIASATLHYQLLTDENKIVGGGNEWILDGIQPNADHTIDSTLALTVPNATKAVYSIDFDAIELVRD